MRYSVFVTHFFMPFVISCVRYLSIDFVSLYSGLGSSELTHLPNFVLPLLRFITP